MLGIKIEESVLMKKLFLFLCIFIINPIFCSSDQQMQAPQHEAPAATRFEAAKCGSTAKRRILIGTLFTIAAAQSVTLLILANKSSDSTNATPEPAPAPSIRYIKRLAGSLPANLQLNASRVYSQDLNFMLNNTRAECAPRFLCNTSLLVGDVEKKALEEVASECSNMPPFVVAQTLTERLDDEDFLHWCEPHHKEEIEYWSQGVFDCIKETCAIIKAQYANAFCPQQPRFNFAVAAGSNLEKSSAKRYVRQRNKRENNAKFLRRSNKHANGGKGKGKH